jgi:pimeloyl-ACP methyl ester carboxylesterase/predicted glycosyltransferase
MRAREPDVSGRVVRGGIEIAYEVFGDAEPTLLLLPTWSIVHSRIWKGQVAPLARHHRVITFDGRGNGKSSQPTDPQEYGDEHGVQDALAVLDATQTEQAVVVGFSAGTVWALRLAADHAERVLGLICVSPSFDLDDPTPDPGPDPFDATVTNPRGWDTYNRQYLLDGGYEDFLDFFMADVFSEPHSTKQIEDGHAWAQAFGPPTIIAEHDGSGSYSAEELRELCGRVQQPLLIIQGNDDRVSPPERAVALADTTGGSLVMLHGAGHAPISRHPVKLNNLIGEFAGTLAGSTASRKGWTRPLSRPKRVLYVSSPIGLGHARRDLAIASELRSLQPGLQIDWLAQHPVTTVLGAEGERVHPASAYLASEAAHIEDESAEHDLHAFQAVRRMDEILVNNFMVYAELVHDEPYDLVVGDEAWDIDYFLHENPELKNTAFAWMTDFVGWLPMPEGGEHERRLTADYNAEMLEQRARFTRIRDRSIFVGNPNDIVPDPFGPGLPSIRDWTTANFDFAGYITGYDPASVRDQGALRAEYGFGDEPVCVVTVGGSGVGTALLDKVVAAFPAAVAAVPGLRMVVVTGPRIDPGSINTVPGLEVHGYLPRLYRLLAASDMAVVQGGLTTCMELTASQRPFIYFPLGRHFEQNFHVRRRLDQYGAGRCMDYRATTPDEIAAAIADSLRRPVNYQPVETDGAARAAAMLAELL